MGKKMHSEDEKLFLKKFGLNVKRLRMELNLSQAEVAFRMGMTTQSLSDIENGKTDCQQTTAYLIAKALGIEMIKLYLFEIRG
jgi:Predicted transcriptional regulators